MCRACGRPSRSRTTRMVSRMPPIAPCRQQVDQEDGARKAGRPRTKTIANRKSTEPAMLPRTISWTSRTLTWRHQPEKRRRPEAGQLAERAAAAASGAPSAADRVGPGNRSAARTPRSSRRHDARSTHGHRTAVARPHQPRMAPASSDSGRSCHRPPRGHATLLENRAERAAHLVDLLVRIAAKNGSARQRGAASSHTGKSPGRKPKRSR